MQLKNLLIMNFPKQYTEIFKVATNENFQQKQTYFSHQENMPMQYTENFFSLKK